MRGTSASALSAMGHRCTGGIASSRTGIAALCTSGRPRDLLAALVHPAIDVGALLGDRAVTIVAWQVVWKHAAAWSSAEVLLLIALLACVIGGRILHVHERWIGYRSLAEAFRSALFITLTGVQPRAEQPAQIGLGEATNEPWFQRAFSEAWRKRPTVSFDALDADRPAPIPRARMDRRSDRVSPLSSTPARLWGETYLVLILCIALLALLIAVAHALSSALRRLRCLSSWR